MTKSELWQGRYEPLEVAGRGGQGEVWRGLDHQHDRIVALKVRNAPPKAKREQVLAEVRTLLSLEPFAHLPLVRDDFFVGRKYVMVMDWIEGADLGKILAARGHPGLSPTIVIDWLAQLAAALDHLHAHHPAVIHGDVKPANAIVTRGGKVVLVDFGISPSSSRRTGGTAFYTAPEAANKAAELTPAADVFGLAATAAALLTGSAPSGGAPRWDGIDPETARIVEGAIGQGLSLDPSRRPPTATALVERIASFAAEPPTGVVTFLLTGIVASTELWDQDTPGTAAALGALDQLVATVVSDNRGFLLPPKPGDDGQRAAFASAMQAIATAGHLRERIRAVVPDPVASRTAIAPYTGEAQRQGRILVGAACERAAALLSQAQPGELVVASSTVAIAKQALPVGARIVVDSGSWWSGRGRALIAAAAAMLALVIAVGVGVTRSGSAATALVLPVGRPILFTSNRDDGVNQTFLFDPGSKKTTRVLPAPRGESDSGGRLSPDGKRVVYVRETASDQHIWVSDTGGANARQLTHTGQVNLQPAWSPDGRQIAFTSVRGGRGQIYVMDAEAGDTNVRALTLVRLLAGEAAWSPDGTMIVFRSRITDGDEDIFTVRADRTNQAGTQLTSGGGINVQPGWSPDGTQIVFTSTRTGTGEIYVMPAAGEAGGLRQVTDLRVDTGGAVWSPDGRVLVFTSRSGDGSYDLVAVVERYQVAPHHVRHTLAGHRR